MLLVRGADKEVKNYNSQSPFQVEWRKKTKKNKTKTQCVCHCRFHVELIIEDRFQPSASGKHFFLFFSSNTFPPSHLLPWQQCKMVKVSCNQGSQLSLWPILDLFHLNSIKWGNQNWASSRDSVSLLSQYRSSSLSGCLYTFFFKKCVYPPNVKFEETAISRSIISCYFKQKYLKRKHSNRLKCELVFCCVFVLVMVEVCVLHLRETTPAALRAAELEWLTHNLRLSYKRALLRRAFMKGSPTGSSTVLHSHSSRALR